MKAKQLATACVGCFLALTAALAAHSRSMHRGSTMDDSAISAPPAAAVKPVTEEYFGTKVTDPYRWLENLNEPDVQKWFKAQGCWRIH
jgi:Prolyl oligopeptidase, N-terminal beta-propeller domain